MPKNQKVKTNFEHSFDLPNPGLRSYFDIVDTGQDRIYHTPWIKVPGEDLLSPEKANERILKQLNSVLSEWLPHLESISKEWPSLFKFENDLAAKVGPMSIMKPLKDRMDDIEAYYKGILLPAEPLDERAIKATLNKFARARGITVRSEQRTVDLMKKSTNSGSPYFLKRRAVTSKTVPCEVGEWYQLLDGGKRSYDIAAVLGWRGQEGGPSVADVKQRVVWMFPYAVNIKELQFYQPMIEAFQRFNLVPAWVSMESVDRAITKLFDTKGSNDLVVCTDFSKFDQHFNSRMQDAARSIIAGLHDRSSVATDWLNNVFPIKYSIPLAYDFGKIRTGEHGMGSGSGGTNADETLSHTALQFEAAQHSNQLLNPYSQCLGDDGVLSYPGINAENVMRSYSAHGLDMNLEKQEESTQDCVYLRRWHHVKYRVNGVCAGVYSTARALGRLCMQERYYDPDVWGPKMVCLRELSIIENCKYHPLKEEFADFCMKRDKFRLGLDIPGFLDNIDGEAKKAIDYMPDFLGYTKSMVKDQTGLSDWWIVRYLKSKA